MAASVGVIGGATMEAIDVIKSVKWHQKLPWNVRSESVNPPQRNPNIRPGEERLPATGRRAYCVAAVMRLFVSGAPTGALAATYPHAINPLLSYMVGLGALSAVQQLASLVPLAVKSTGRAALGSVMHDAQNHQTCNVQRNVNSERTLTESVPDGGPESDTSITMGQVPREKGGQK